MSTDSMNSRGGILRRMQGDRVKLPLVLLTLVGVGNEVEVTPRMLRGTVCRKRRTTM